MVLRTILALTLALLPGQIRQEPSAPTLALKDLRGRTVRLESFRGKVVLLNFWATWCPPCRAEIPDLVALQRDHGAKGLQVVGVTCPPYSRAAVTKFVKDQKVTYPILLGTKGLAARLTGTDVLPTTLVIDRDGSVRATIEGILTPEEVAEKILPLLETRDST
jgi:thiol-disulfide isomerase/thioredoxin